ncbi:iron-containing alcohol dehydrogenase [Thiomicrospira microaerophila]|uniref:iron-containing alcohol dehydrogenase n=1 Tax=Thiomicrospira microaerophila TaxID=406020 RepID=UPI0005CB2483|nr:iron-containing alcohol dehydrogenase [Thiomicrospira microaerophila]
MIPPFNFAQMPAIEFGWQVTQTKLSDAILAASQQSILLVSSGYVNQHYVDSRLAKVLAQRNVLRCVVQGEPSPDLIDQIVKEAPQDIELVIGFGGGSVLDAAKAIAGLLPERHSVVDYLEGVGCGRKLQTQPVPFWAIPTTAGTGSETTKNAVISRHGEFKKSFRDDRLLANQAWLDPSLLVSCPKSVLYPTAMDAFTQLLESYVTLKANPMTDALAWQGIQLFNGAFALLESDDQARQQQGYSRLMLAASFSGMTLANAGLGAVHGLAGPVGAYFEAPHGLVCARLLAPITRMNIQALPDSDAAHAQKTLAKYKQVAALLTGKSEANALISHIDHLVQQYVPQGLADFGLTKTNLGPVIDQCRAGSMLGNPVVLSDQDLLGALFESLGR